MLSEAVTQCVQVLLHEPQLDCRLTRRDVHIYTRHRCVWSNHYRLPVLAPPDLSLVTLLNVDNRQLQFTVIVLDSHDLVEPKQLWVLALFNSEEAKQQIEGVIVLSNLDVCYSLCPYSGTFIIDFKWKRI